MKRTALTAALPALLLALLLAGCAQPAGPAADASAAASTATSDAPFIEAPTAAPAASPSPSATKLRYPPSMDQQLEPYEIDDPMMEYQESLVTPEEQVIRERIYEAVAEIINSASPNHASRQEFTASMYDRGLVTKRFVELSPPSYGPLNTAMRKADLSRQVTSLYCPMHVQTSSVLDMGWTSCYYKAKILDVNSHALQLDSFISILGEDNKDYFLDPFDGRGTRAFLQQRVELAKENGIWKVDSFTLTYDR
ncbi:MAG TPA: hypothetical protein VF885_13610 [Arthrobacter sp.]